MGSCTDSHDCLAFKAFVKDRAVSFRERRLWHSIVVVNAQQEKQLVPGIHYTFQAQ